MFYPFRVHFARVLGKATTFNKTTGMCFLEPLVKTEASQRDACVNHKSSDLIGRKVSFQKHLVEGKNPQAVKVSLDNTGNGTILSYNAVKGWGFVKETDGQDCFMHNSEMEAIQGDGHVLLIRRGDVLEYENEDTEKGPLATKVRFPDI
mmetsp:Transcript_37296/g.66525  ORF Transcript_37296/g.66525 Transcript_37296/m.66525 type:complete len:149 (-) Transcript_37296:845-1291(-)